MRDVIFEREPKGLPAIYYHIIAWVLFVSYEIVLSSAIRGTYNHFLDYLLHYPVYISLFYAHCYLILGNIRLKKPADYYRLTFLILLEAATYYGCNVLINMYLVNSGIPVNVSETISAAFAFSTFYRFIYFTILSTGLRIAINLVEAQKRNLEHKNKALIRERERESLETELIKAKLAHLLSQISPHLLFNSLNSLYNRIRKIDPSSAEYVMALAGLMQYALRPERETPEVPLEWEVEYISNYLKIQTMREHCEVNYSANIQNPEFSIIPRLLISAVENIFEHGDLKHPEMPLISVTESGGRLVLKTRNRIRSDDRPGNGLGLSTTRKLLNGYYNDRHELEYRAEQDIFTFTLVINLT